MCAGGRSEFVAGAAAANKQVGNPQRRSDVQRLGHLKALDEAANRRRWIRALLLRHDALLISATDIRPRLKIMRRRGAGDSIQEDRR